MSTTASNAFRTKRKATVSGAVLCGGRAERQLERGRREKNVIKTIGGNDKINNKTTKKNIDLDKNSKKILDKTRRATRTTATRTTKTDLHS